MIVEPVQGEIGVIPAETDFLQKLRRWTREEDILLILDEIQTGLGRTGSLLLMNNMKSFRIFLFLRRPWGEDFLWGLS